MHFGFPQSIFRVTVGIFKHQGRVLFGCAADPPQIVTAILPGSKWSVLFLRIVMQYAMSEVWKVYPQLKRRFFCRRHEASFFFFGE